MSDANAGLGIVGKLVATLVLWAIFGAIAYFNLPGVLTDMRTSDWQPALGLRLESPKCTRYYFVASSCSADYVDTTKPGAPRKSLSYFTLGGWGGERVGLVRSASNPETVSLDVATKAMPGRIGLLGAFFALALILTVMVFRQRGPADVA